MKEKINKLTYHVERTEAFTNYLLRKKFESIQKSLIRPLYQEVLKSLFLILILLVDTLIPLELYLDLPNILNILLSITVLCIFLYVEMHIYNLLWGKNGRWSLEKYKKNLITNKKLK
jgi:hypothetical protein